MRFRLGVAVLATVAIMVLVGCATSAPKLAFEPGTIDRGAWVPKADRFEVIVDASRTMGDAVGRERKVEIAQAVAESIGRTIPEFDYVGGLRTFGQGSCLPKEKTSLIGSMGAYSTSSFVEAAGRITCAAHTSPLNLALTAAGSDLTGAKDRAALVVISDGLHMGKEEVAAAQALKATYGDKLCIHAVQVGSDPVGRALLEKVVSAAGCGKVVAADELMTGPAMAGFVQEALLEHDGDGDGVGDSKDRCPNTPKGVKVDAVGCPLDSDGDGVPNNLDKCPDTPKGVKVDAVGCPLDSDGDGVPDYLDKCPDTPKGVKVDAAGCPIDSDGDGVPDNLDKCPDTPKGMPVNEVGCPPTLATVQFVTDQWTLDKEARSILDKAATFMITYPAAKVEVQGHTDNTGPRRWNNTLSLWRAEAVIKYLLGKQVSADRLTPKGYGPDQPAVPNDTRADRAKNRRAEVKP
jgi:OOP family OmpA-OmpF porin